MKINGAFLPILVALICFGCSEKPFEPITLQPVIGSRIVIVKDSIVDNAVSSSDTLEVRSYDISGMHLQSDIYETGKIYLKSTFTYTDSSCILMNDWVLNRLKKNAVSSIEYRIQDKGFERIVILYPADTFSILDYTMNEDFEFTRIQGVRFSDSIKSDVDEYFRYDKHGTLQKHGTHPNLQNNTSMKKILGNDEVYVNSYRGDTLVKQEMRKAGRIEYSITYEYRGDTLIESKRNPYGRLETKTYKSLSRSYFYKYRYHKRLFKIEYFKNRLLIGRDNYILEQIRRDI